MQQINPQVLRGAPGLTDDEVHLLSELLAQYNQHLSRNGLRSNYFEGRHRLRQLGLTLPPSLSNLDTVVGWPTQAVTTLENRLDLDGFVRADKSEIDDEIAELFAQNNMRIDSSQAHTAAYVHGTSFVAVTAGIEPDDPAAVITVHSALQATGLWDPRKRRLTAGLIVEQNDDKTKQFPRRLSLLTDTHLVVITFSPSARGEVERLPHGLNRVPMVALSHRPWLERPFGVSRISRAVMSLTDQAVRCIMRTEAAAEFFSFPQRFILGADKDSFDKAGWELYMDRLMAIERDENGELPQVQQLNAASLQPHIDELRSIAMMFSGETGIPPSYLGIIHDNPASADAIRAGEAKLVKIAERDQVVFGQRWCEVARLAIELATGEETPLNGLQARWKDASTPTKSAQAQAVMTLVQAGVLPARSEVTYELLGYDATTINRLMAEKARMESDEMFKALSQLAPRGQQLPKIKDGEAWPHEFED